MPACRSTQSTSSDGGGAETVHEYERCHDLYDRAGIDLTREPLVGLGSVCRRQATGEAHDIIRRLRARGITRLHGFGVKTLGLRRYGHLLTSADCMVLYLVRSCRWILISNLPLVRTGYKPGSWVVFRYDLERPHAALDDPLLMTHAGSLDGLAVRGRRHGQAFLIGPDGRADVRRG